MAVPRVTNQQISDKLDQVLEKNTAIENRLNEMNLNGAAAFLRELGYIFRDNPGALELLRSDLNEGWRRKIAFEYMSEWLRIPVVRYIQRFVALGIFGGILFALGSTYFGPFIAHVLKHIVHP